VNALSKIKYLSIICIIILISCTKGPIKKRDKPLLITTPDIIDLGYSIKKYKQYEKMSRTKFLDGSIEIEYELDMPDNKESSVYIYNSISIDTDLKDARHEYKILKFTHMKVLKSEESKKFFSYGDESFFAYIINNKEKTGTLFLARKGKKIYSLITGGIVFDNKKEWISLVKPKLDYMTKYKP